MYGGSMTLPPKPAILTKGDLPGHPFHGNQYTGGIGGGGTRSMNMRNGAAGAKGDQQTGTLGKAKRPKGLMKPLDKNGHVQPLSAKEADRAFGDTPEKVAAYIRKLGFKVAPSVDSNIDLVNESGGNLSRSPGKINALVKPPADVIKYCLQGQAQALTELKESLTPAAWKKLRAGITTVSVGNIEYVNSYDYQMNSGLSGVYDPKRKQMTVYARTLSSGKPSGNADSYAVNRTGAHGNAQSPDAYVAFTYGVAIHEIGHGFRKGAVPGKTASEFAGSTGLWNAPSHRAASTYGDTNAEESFAENWSARWLLFGSKQASTRSALSRSPSYLSTAAYLEPIFKADGIIMDNLENMHAFTEWYAAWRDLHGISKGDRKGHPFRGNQYVEGVAGSSSRATRMERAVRTSMKGKNSPAALEVMALAGGFTYNPKRNEVRHEGISVAISKKYEKKYRLDDFKADGEHILREYVSAHAKQLAMPGNHLGAWKARGHIFLDVSAVKGNVSEAANHGRAHDQIGLFDLKTYTEWYRFKSPSTRKYKYLPMKTVTDKALIDQIGKASDRGVLLVPGSMIDSQTIPMIVERILGLQEVSGLSKDDPGVSDVHVDSTEWKTKRFRLARKKMKMLASLKQRSGGAARPSITKGDLLKDPKGGLTAAGREKFNRETGSNLKPGVKGKADTPEKMRRKGSFLTRFFTNPSGPMVGDNGKPTRLALSAAAWGEPVPKTAEAAAALAAKGRNLLARYENVKKGDLPGHLFHGNQHTRIAIAAQTKEIMGLLTKKAGEQVASGLEPLVKASIEEFHKNGASDEPLLVNGKKVSMGGQVVTAAGFLDLLVSELGMKAVYGRDFSASDFKDGEKFLTKSGGLTQYERVNKALGDEPSDPALYERVKAEAKKKFDVYPSAYANGWLVQEYKRRGGKYRKIEKGDDPGHSFRGNQYTGGIGGSVSRQKMTRGGAIIVRTVEEAIPLILAGKDVQMPTVKGVSTLIKKLGEMALADKSLSFDMCKVSVSGTNLFCSGNKGIPRIRMPQAKGEAMPMSRAERDLKAQNTKRKADGKSPTDEVDGTKHFLKALENAGITHSSPKRVRSDQLKATQRDMEGAKITRMITNKDFDPSSEPIFVSKDGYVVDGHHRWAATLGRDLADGKLGNGHKMNVIVLNAPISTILRVANKWTQDYGIKPKTVGVEKGDFPGHPFRGNQYTGGIGGKGTRSFRMAVGKTPAKKAPAKEKTTEQKARDVKGLSAERYEVYDKHTGDHDVSMRAALAHNRAFTGTPAPGFSPWTQARANKLQALGYRVPPAWERVQLSNSDKGNASGLIATGYDLAGRKQPLYSAAHTKSASTNKFARVDKAFKDVPKLDKALAQDAMSNDDAACTLIIREMGMRPGSTKETGGLKKAYGATTLLAKHITLNAAKQTVRFQFTGKKGVWQDHTTTNKAIYQALAKRKAASKSPSDPIFDTSGPRTNIYIKSKMGRAYSNKDLRTLKGTSLAMDLVKRSPAPTTKTQFKMMQKAIYVEVASHLGNAWTETRDSYINPMVFAAWEAGVGI